MECLEVACRRKVKVLHVDNDVEFLKSAKAFLEENFQFEVETASSSDEVLEKVKVTNYDAIVSAYLISRRNGLELLNELRRRGNDVPFFLLTCKPRAEVAIDALNSGVDGYVAKGSDAEAMFQELSKDIYSTVKTRTAIRLLEESEERYRKQFEEANDAIFLADIETGIIIDCNSAATKLIRKGKSEIVGMHQRFLHPNPEKSKIDFEQQVKDLHGRVLERQVVTSQGEIRDVAIMTSVFEVEGKKLVQGIFRDVTEWKRTLEKVNFQSRLLNAVGQPLVATDACGIIKYWNKAAEKAYGYSEKIMIGTDIVSGFILKAIPKGAKGMLSNMSAGLSWTNETVIKREDGSFSTMIMTTSPIIGAKGEFDGVIGVATDITQQKWMAEALTETIQKIQDLNDKMHFVGSLTRHDVRNKLAALNGNLYLLKKHAAGNVTYLERIRDMEQVLQQIVRILEFEKTYVQVGVEELTYVDVEAFLQEAASLYSDLKGVQLVNECRGLMVLADSLLRQVFYNLIDNTLKYGEKTTTIRVHYEDAGNGIRLIYEDDGVGLSDDLKGNLFTEGYGKGTGYGLYLIRRICSAYGWTIEETGKAGKGAQFTMTIPNSEKECKESYTIK